MQGTSMTATMAAPEPAAFAACGIALALSARHILNSQIAAARLLGQLVHALASELPLALRIDGLASGDEARERLDAVCNILARALERAALEPSRIEITIDASAMGPAAAWEIRRRQLGYGTVNLVLDEASLHCTSRAAGGFWQQLWQLRSCPVVAACSPAVTSRCPLLSAETAADVIPATGMQVPSQTAWLGGALNLARFADDAGSVDLEMLDRTLCRYVDAADSIHDVTAWPTPRMQHDAWLNRRLAIRVQGIGDLAARRGLDPDLHSSMLELDALLLSVRRFVERRSRQIAQCSETLPAIAAANPCAHRHEPQHREDWEARWLRAIGKFAARHRNLIVMSPWSIFPNGDADYRFANLLPLLAHADTCEFRRAFNLDKWSLRDFTNFHRRVWAVRRRNESSMAVAERL